VFLAWLLIREKKREKGRCLIADRARLSSGQEPKSDKDIWYVSQPRTGGRTFHAGVFGASPENRFIVLA
jgi:hypothetical protein